MIQELELKTNIIDIIEDSTKEMLDVTNYIYPQLQFPFIWDFALYGFSFP